MQEVVAGLLDSSAEGIRRQDAGGAARPFPREPDTVIASIGDDPRGVNFSTAEGLRDLRARVVKKGGRVALHHRRAGFGAGSGNASASSTAPTARRSCWRWKKPEELAAATLWALGRAASEHAAWRVAILMMWPKNFRSSDHIRTRRSAAASSTPCGTVLLIPDAHKTTW